MVRGKEDVSVPPFPITISPKSLMAFVKICGITNLEDALVCVEAGADALGFNFYRPSPRYVDPGVVRKIIQQLPESVLTVGVFVNEETPRSVETIANESGVTALQLHGTESPEYCGALYQRYVIKVLAVNEHFEPQAALLYNVQAIMLDASDRRHGGTGRVINWSLARLTRELVPKLFLAGGLSSENVGEAIKTVGPYGVDSCSALEVTPGKKDPERVRAFVHAAHEMRPPVC
jgi:phosphoribosylanthranilate isomerase